ncbi:MAG: hypothetical protein LUD47_01760 [Clostridia bacterium]|nr:hypothetical protein [Clostridia bacterium]
MSVLQEKRHESKIEFVNTARLLYAEVINFLSRLSARYSRLIAGEIAKLAIEVISEAEKANSIFPNDAVRYELRERHLLESKAALDALDVQLTYCYMILIENPQGAFVSVQTGKPLKSEIAKKKLDNMAQKCGNLLNTEGVLLTGQLKMIEEKKREMS